MSKTPTKTPSKLQQHLTSKQRTPGTTAQKSNKKLSTTRPTSASTATTEEDEPPEDDSTNQIQKSDKKKSKKSLGSSNSTSTAAVSSNDPMCLDSKSKVASNDQDEDEGEISLFHPSTHLAPVSQTITPDTSNSNGHTSSSSHMNGNSTTSTATDSLTSSDFLQQLIHSQTPDLLHLLQEVQSKMKDIRKQSVRPLLRELKDGNLPTQEGMSFLELKSHLLLQYLQHLVYFILIKLSPATDTAKTQERIKAVVKQLVYLRTVMEKLKPLDKKLKYQIEKMIKLGNHMNKASAVLTSSSTTATTDGDTDTVEDMGHDIPAMPSTADGADPLSYRPDPSALLAASQDAAAVNGEDDDGPKLYRAPRITATQLDDHEKSTDRRNKAKLRAQERAKNSDYLNYLRQDMGDAPEEQRIDMDDARPDAETQERLEFEERNMIRLTDTRKDKARKKEKLRASKNSLFGLEGGEDDYFKDMERTTRELDRDDYMSADRMNELQQEAMGRKRKSRSFDGGDDGMEFDDPTESRHAKKRKGPNAKNSFGSKFANKGKGRGGKSRR